MKIELNEDFLSKIITKFIAIQNVRNLKVEIQENYINIKGNYIAIPFALKLVPIKTKGSTIVFSVEGLASHFLPNISQKGISLKDKTLEINLSEYIEDLEVKNITITKGKVYLEI